MQSEVGNRNDQGAQQCSEFEEVCKFALDQHVQAILHPPRECVLVGCFGGSEFLLWLF